MANGRKSRGDARRSTATCCIVFDPAKEEIVVQQDVIKKYIPHPDGHGYLREEELVIARLQVRPKEPRRLLPEEA